MNYLVMLILFTSCISIKKYHRALKDYQIELHMDTVWVHDKRRLVGMFIHTDSSWNNQYDSVFIKDNQ
jgi:hypothetical protein